MRAALCGMMLVFLVGCGGGKKTTEVEKADGPTVTGKAEKAAPAPERDFAEFVAELRSTVPVRVDEFKATKFKCDPYVTSRLAGVEIFESLTLTLDPISLRDSLTGKSQKYIGARMLRSNNGDVFATGTSPAAVEQRDRGIIPITWDSVTMIAEGKPR
jgi:hypothetical protein